MSDHNERACKNCGSLLHHEDDCTRETGIQCHGHFGPCESKNATRQRQNTAYNDDERNWVTLCPECAKANDEHWAEMWREYYSGCL